MGLVPRRGPAATSCATALTTKVVVADVTDAADAPAPGQRDLRLDRQLPGPGRRGQGPPHPVHARRRGTRRGQPGADRPMPAGPRRRAKAQATYDTLKALAGKPDELTGRSSPTIAKAESKDTGVGCGRWRAGLVHPVARSTPGFGDAIFAGRPQEGRPVIGPVARASTAGTSSCTRIDARRRKDRIDGDARPWPTRPVPTSAKLAKENSDSCRGGDGWRPRLGRPATSSMRLREAAIFAAPVGKASDVLIDRQRPTTSSSVERGSHSRKPDGAQLETLKGSAFQQLVRRREG